MTATVQSFHGVDILVSNAGIVRASDLGASDFLATHEGDWDDVMRVNLKGVFLVRPAPLAAIMPFLDP